jgi:hypothetical protein
MYLTLSAIGLVATAYYNFLAFREFGAAYTPIAFIRAGFEGSPIVGSLAADFSVGAIASMLWILAEARLLGMRKPGWYIVLCLVTAWACGLPWFLYMRERHLARGGQTARFAAARLAGRSAA